MKKGVFCLALTAVLTLQSCSIKNNSREDLTIRIENSLVDNVYKHIKMDYFHGFIDRQTVDDLIKYHGQPDSIFDAYESTTIENYDIYEYRFDDGAINCYVPTMIFMNTALTMEQSIVMFLIMVMGLDM